jgi:hypothetical protein
MASNRKDRPEMLTNFNSLSRSQLTQASAQLLCSETEEILEWHREEIHFVHSRMPAEGKVIHK